MFGPVFENMECHVAYMKAFGQKTSMGIAYE